MRDVHVIHLLRIAGYMAGGAMPTAKFGERKEDTGWFSWSLNLELAIGSW